MKKNNHTKKKPKSPIEPATQEEKNESEHGSDKQKVPKDADYDNQGRPNSPF